MAMVQVCSWSTCYFTIYSENKIDFLVYTSFKSHDDTLIFRWWNWKKWSDPLWTVIIQLFTEKWLWNQAERYFPSTKKSRISFFSIAVGWKFWIVSKTDKKLFGVPMTHCLFLPCITYKFQFYSSKLFSMVKFGTKLTFVWNRISYHIKIDR